MKSLSKILLAVMIAMMLCSQSAFAEDQDVTADHQEEVGELLKHFDAVFGYACGDGVDFRFNKYTRTVMLFHSDLTDYQAETEKAKEAIQPLMEEYFGKKKKVAFHPCKGDYYPDVSWLWTDDQGTLRYRMGDWGEVYPVGRVLSVVQKGKKKLLATYQICWYHLWNDSLGDEMGVFEVTLRKKDGRYIIKNIQRTRSSNVSI